MTPTQSFRIASRLTLTTMLVMFGLIVIGSVVRTTGSGLACPDWPLCQGRLIPPLQFNVLVEWFHRLTALLTSVALFVTVAWVLVHPATRARLGALAGLAIALLFVQVMLGALTVWKLLSPSVVSGHLAVALLLFVTMLSITLVARAASRPAAVREPRPAGLLATLATATALAYVQSLLGGIVSTTHAGLACPDWPACDGRWFPALTTLAGLQMLHRYGAYALTAAVMMVAIRSRSAPDAAVRTGGSLAFGLTLAQVVVGVANVLGGIPAWLSAVHLANAAAILATLVATTFRVARMPTGAGSMALATSP